MTIREAIHTDLHDLTALTDIISTRIYEIEAESGEMDNFVVWMKVDDPRVHRNENVRIPLRLARFQFSCYSTDRFEARNIAAIIDEHYRDYKGVLASGVNVQQAYTIDDRDQGREGDFFRVEIDIQFKYKEAA
jgi:hypothetical protein